MEKLVLIGWFFVYWLVLFAGTMGMIYLATNYFVKTSPIIRTGKEEEESNNNVRTGVLIILLLTLAVSLKLLGFNLK